MKKTLTSILLGTSLVGSLLFNSCNYKKTSENKIQAIEISQEDTLLKTANNLYFQGDYNLAKENYLKFLEIKKNKNDSLGIAKGFQNLGLVANIQGNYDEAIKYNLNALNIYENLKDSFRVAQLSNNIGLIYLSQNKGGKALEYFKKDSLIKSILLNENSEESLLKSNLSITLNNMGAIYEKQNKKNEALKCYFNSLEFAKKSNNHAQEANCYNRIAVISGKQGDLEKAFEYYQKSLEINKDLGDKDNSALNLMNIADIYRIKGNSFQALKNLNNSFEIAKEINSPDLLKDIYLTFSETYEAKGNLDSALKYFKKYSEIKDTLLNSESLKQVAELETKYQSEKKEQENKSLKKDNELKEAKNEKQKWGLMGLAGILGLSGVLGYSFYRGRKKERRAKEKEKEANKLLEEKNKIIEKQKLIVEEKNTEIIDSINYAKNIQRAVLPRDEEFKRLLPESFVLYKPKDIVSGDFYWLAEEFNKIYFAACDSTGHGVPGAFMSMLNSRLLSEAVNEKQIEKPNEIFNYVKQKIVNSLKSRGETGEQKDGMDAVLCSLDSSKNNLEFACANNSLCLIRNNQLTEFKADKMPVGYSDKTNSFTLHSEKLEKNDAIYIFSDGYKDQFGGEHGKKFMSKNLKELLLEINKKPMSEQKEILNNKIENWMAYLDENKKPYSQNDDILVIGVRF